MPAQLPTAMSFLPQNAYTGPFLVPSPIRFDRRASYRQRGRASAGAPRKRADNPCSDLVVLRVRQDGVSCHHPNHLLTRVSNTPPCMPIGGFRGGDRWTGYGLESPRAAIFDSCMLLPFSDRGELAIPRCQTFERESSPDALGGAIESGRSAPKSLVESPHSLVEQQICEAGRGADGSADVGSSGLRDRRLGGGR